MIKQITFAIIIGVLITLGSCNDNITGPEQPGRRDYVWTIDTVVSPSNYPFKFLLRLWASSPTDVWATGHGGDDTKDIFHFDGNSWASGGKYNIPWLPNSIYGFSTNNVYIGCEAGRIYHYDGSSMKEVAALTKDGHSDIVFDMMWGESVWGIPGDLYATGAYPDSQGLANGSVIAQYKNNKWTMLNTDGLEGIVEPLYKSQTDNKIYLQATKYSNTFDSTFIYEYDHGKYIKLFGTQWNSHWTTISLINNEVYFVLKDKIARRINNQFDVVLDLSNTNFYDHIWGRNPKDIFLQMTDGLAHYNGTDIKYLLRYKTQTYIYGAALFNDDVFFLVYESQKGLSLVYHGKLN